MSFAFGVAGWGGMATFGEDWAKLFNDLFGLPAWLWWTFASVLSAVLVILSFWKPSKSLRNRKPVLFKTVEVPAKTPLQPPAAPADERDDIDRAVDWMLSQPVSERDHGETTLAHLLHRWQKNIPGGIKASVWEAWFARPAMKSGTDYMAQGSNHSHACRQLLLQVEDLGLLRQSDSSPTVWTDTPRLASTMARLEGRGDFVPLPRNAADLSSPPTELGQALLALDKHVVQRGHRDGALGSHLFLEAWRMFLGEQFSLKRLQILFEDTESLFERAAAEALLKCLMQSGLVEVVPKREERETSYDEYQGLRMDQRHLYRFSPMASVLVRDMQALRADCVRDAQLLADQCRDIEAAMRAAAESGDNDAWVASLEEAKQVQQSRGKVLMSSPALQHLYNAADVNKITYAHRWAGPASWVPALDEMAKRLDAAIKCLPPSDPHTSASPPT